MPHHFAPTNGIPTIPGGAVIDRPNLDSPEETTALNHLHNSTMRQIQANFGNDSGQLGAARDSVAGPLSTTSLTPTITGFDGNNPLLRSDTLPGATTNAINVQLTDATTLQADWLQKAELLHGEAKDTISAAGPDAQHHLENISVQGNPYFINGTVQDTIRAVGVTVSGGAAPYSDTVSGTLRDFGQGQTAPFNSYHPLPLKDDSGNLLYPKEGILPEGFGKDSFHPMTSDKGALLDPHHKIDSKSSLVDLLHQLDHQVTIDLGKYSGVSAEAADLAKTNSFTPDHLKNSLAHTDEPIGSKTDDSLVTLLDEEQKKRMATNINLSGPFGGNH